MLTSEPKIGEHYEYSGRSMSPEIIEITDIDVNLIGTKSIFYKILSNPNIVGSANQAYFMANAVGPIITSIPTGHRTTSPQPQSFPKQQTLDVYDAVIYSMYCLDHCRGTGILGVTNSGGIGGIGGIGGLSGNAVAGGAGANGTNGTGITATAGTIGSGGCDHKYEQYNGFTESYEFCTKCDHKRNNS